MCEEERFFKTRTQDSWIPRIVLEGKNVDIIANFHVLKSKKSNKGDLKNDACSKSPYFEPGFRFPALATVLIAILGPLNYQLIGRTLPYLHKLVVFEIGCVQEKYQINWRHQKWFKVGIMTIIRTTLQFYPYWQILLKRTQNVYSQAQKVWKIFRKENRGAGFNSGLWPYLEPIANFANFGLLSTKATWNKSQKKMSVNFAVI